MVERICPTCQHANPLDDRFCGKCGAPLERQVLARRENTGLTIAGKNLPVSWQQVGKTAALGAAALAIEAGLSWLQRRMASGASSTSPLSQALTSTKQHKPSTTAMTRTTGRAVTIVSQRVIEILRNSDGNVQITDRHTWRRTEE
jgi:uncharacterized membrane protein YvbJ